VDIRQIGWRETIPVRHRVLWPNKHETFCHVAEDEMGIHFGAFVNDILVCVASIYIDGNRARLRKYATEFKFQGLGIGSAVLNNVITYLITLNIDYFWCDARESAFSFYQRFGMTKEGVRFYKAEVPYFKMAMNISPAGRTDNTRT